MRISVSMLRRLSVGILISIVVLLSFPLPVSADTGTYKILDYIVTLEPQNDGRVLITVAQQWQVTSGDIPWVTVGLPNQSFEIKDFSGDVSGVSDGSGSGFYGVRLDLTKDFKQGSIFNIKFAVLQSKILERLTSENVWRIGFTPGWYDRAPIAHLQINLVSPVDYTTYTSVSPMPAVKGNVLTWEGSNLGPGQQMTVTVKSADGSFLTAAEPAVKSSSGGLGSGFWVFVIILVIIGLLIFWGISQSKRKREAYIRSKATAIEDEMAKDPLKKEAIEGDFKESMEKKGIQPDAQGRYYDRSYGGYMTPAIWWAVLASQQNTNAPPSNNANSNPGCVYSCACVSCACACACACAGGGAAGCSRKTLHDFRTSQVKKENILDTTCKK
jgi:hypothetical protein